MIPPNCGGLGSPHARMNWPGTTIRHRSSTRLICCRSAARALAVPAGSTGELRNPKHDFEARVNLATNSSRFSCDWSWGRYRRRSCLTFWQEQTLVFTLALTDSHCLRTHRSLQSTVSLHRSLHHGVPQTPCHCGRGLCSGCCQALQASAEGKPQGFKLTDRSPRLARLLDWADFLS